jgi:hypothetical protein
MHGVEVRVDEDPAADRRRRQEEEDAEAARRAFADRSMPDLGEEDIEEDMMDEPVEVPAASTFSKKPKEKKDFSAVLGIKKKAPAPAVVSHVKTPAPPSKLSTMLVAGYDSDDD